MSKLMKGLLLGGLALFGSCGALVCVANLAEDDPAEQKKKSEERKALVDKVAKQLVTIRTDFPAQLAEAPCPDASIPEATVAHVADFDHLERFTKPGVDPETEPFKKWSWLTSASIRDFKPPAQIKEPLHTWELDGMIGGLEELQKARYLVVFRADGDAKIMPEVRESKSFVGGLFEGWAVVYDLQTEKPVCQVAVKAESSDSVSHRSRGILGKSGEDAISKDFKDQFEKAARESLAKISKKLRIEL